MHRAPERPRGSRRGTPTGASSPLLTASFVAYPYKVSFVHLHCHSEYSLLDGANRIDDLIARALEFEQPALAITDHGNMHAAWEFQEKAKKAGLKPIIGMEAYVAPGDRRARDRVGRRRASQSRYYHLVLLARNATGYKNLVKLSSLGYTEGFYSKPRVDRELLAQVQRGNRRIVRLHGRRGRARICSSDRLRRGARSGGVVRRALQGIGTTSKCRRTTAEGQAQLNDRRLSSSPRSSGFRSSRRTTRISSGARITTSHDVLLCIGLGKDCRRREPDALRSTGSTSRARREMRERFPDAARRSREHAARSPTRRHRVREEVPRAVLSAAGGRRERERAARHGSPKTGARERYGDPLPEDVRERARLRARTSSRRRDTPATSSSSYDFIKAARDRGIPVGPGRGSAAGSLVAYALRITDVCPLKFDLLFERFLNPERVSMPDIDVDFCFERRGEVIEYVRQKYGTDSVGQIITFGTLKSRAAVKDVGRTLGFTPAETDALAKLIPNQPNFSLTVKEAVEQIAEVEASSTRNDERYKRAPRLRDRARRSVAPRGRARGGRRHRARPARRLRARLHAVVQGRRAASGDEAVVVTQYDMNGLEKAGMLKMDFLGLTTLTVITDAVATIASARARAPDLDALPLDDDETYHMLRAGQDGRRVPVRVAARDRPAALACAATASTISSRPTR